jgi:tRNA dimethylallyltransferase
LATDLKTPRSLAIVGPTASGKTALSLVLANSLDGEIVSVDSRQMFRYLDIGTAKPARADQVKVPHHFIDVFEPTIEYSAGKFGIDCRKVITAIQRRGKTPILVGGSGLYLKAVIDGLGDVPDAKQEIRTELEEEVQRLGLAHLIEELRAVDPATLNAMTQVNTRRVLRALEVYRTSGVPLSKLHAKQEKNRPLNVYQVGLRWSRPDLHLRINDRVDQMIRDDLEDETRKLLSRGFDRRLNSFNTVGYKEVCEHLEGRITRDAMVEAIKRNTRRFAKRQMTWFKADKRIHWIDLSPVSQFEEIAAKIERMFLENSDAEA